MPVRVAPAHAPARRPASPTVFPASPVTLADPADGAPAALAVRTRHTNPSFVVGSQGVQPAGPGLGKLPSSVAGSGATVASRLNWLNNSSMSAAHTGSGRTARTGRGGVGSSKFSLVPPPLKLVPGNWSSNRSAAALVRFHALSALPDVEDATLSRYSLRFVFTDVEKRYGEFRRNKLSDYLLWCIVLACLLGVGLAVGNALVLGRVEALVVSTLGILVLWAGAVCVTATRPFVFWTANVVFCAAVMCTLSVQPFSSSGDVADPFSATSVSDTALQIIPWAPLIPAACALGWLPTAATVSVWLVFMLVVSTSVWPLGEATVVPLLVQCIGVGALVLVFAYRSSRLSRQVWYLQRGSPAARARHVAHARALQPPREPREFILPLARVVDLLVNAQQKERSPMLAQSLQSCLDVVYTHGNFVVPPAAHQQMLEELGRRDTFMDENTSTWMRRELIQQVPMLGNTAGALGNSRLTIEATQEMHSGTGGGVAHHPTEGLESTDAKGGPHGAAPAARAIVVRGESGEGSGSGQGSANASAAGGSATGTGSGSGNSGAPGAAGSRRSSAHNEVGAGVGVAAAGAAVSGATALAATAVVVGAGVGQGQSGRSAGSGFGGVAGSSRSQEPRSRAGVGDLKPVPRGRGRGNAGLTMQAEAKHERGAGGGLEPGVGVARAVPVAPVLGLDEREMMTAEEDVTDWAFDVLTWAEKCRQPLTWTTETLLFKFGIAQKLELHSQVLRRFLLYVETNYCFDVEHPNSYHNALHAAFVVQAVGHFMSVKPISSMLHDLDGLAVLLAAAVHDFRHPGVSNNFLITTQSKLAIRYNDISVLENFHCAEAFELLQQPMYNVLSDLGKEKRAHVRFVVIQCVLATDLSHGQQFTNMFKAKVRRSNLSSTAEDKLLLMQVLLKCADVSHPARPLRIHKKWSHLIAEEFYAQGDLERTQGLPVSPLCDRNDADLSRSQRGFIDFVCRPCFGPFGKFCGVDMWSEMLRLNKAYWRSQAQDATAMSSRSLRSNMSSRPERDASPARTGPAPRRSSAARRVVPPSAMARFEADTPDTDSKQGDSSDFSGSVRQFGGSVTSSVPGTSRRGTRKSARGLTLQDYDDDDRDLDDSDLFSTSDRR